MIKFLNLLFLRSNWGRNATCQSWRSCSIACRLQRTTPEGNGRPKVADQNATRFHGVPKGAVGSIRRTASGWIPLKFVFIIQLFWHCLNLIWIAGLQGETGQSIPSPRRVALPHPEPTWHLPITGCVGSSATFCRRSVQFTLIQHWKCLSLFFWNLTGHLRREKRKKNRLAYFTP